MARTGTGITISKLENGGWRAQLRKAGFPQQSKNFSTKKEAEEWRTACLAEIQRGGRLANRSASERNTLGGVITTYLEKITVLLQQYERTSVS